jgi:hypothetical protein
MFRNTHNLYRFAVYAALVALTGSLGWALIHAGLTLPSI